MKTAWIVVLVLLLLSVAGNVIQWKSARDQELNILANNSLLQTEILKHTATAKMAAARGDSIEAKRSVDSLKFEGQKTALNSQIRTYKKTIASMRPEVVPQIDSLPLVKEFLALQDSTITEQDSLIVVLNGHLYSVSKSFTAQLFQKDVEIRALTSMNQDFQKQLAISQGETRKEKRKVKFWKVTAGILTAGIIYMAVKN